MGTPARSVLAVARWIERECSQSSLAPWLVAATGTSILLSPWLTPYSFGRDWITRLEVDLAALHLAALVLTVIALHRIATESLARGGVAIILARPLSRTAFVGALGLGCVFYVARLLLILSCVAVVPGVIHGPLDGWIGEVSPNGSIGVASWCGTIAVSFYLLVLQVAVLALLGVVLCLLVPQGMVPAALIALYVIAHAATSGIAAVGDTQALAIPRILLKFLPRFADLTPYNLLDEAGRIPFSRILLATLNGLGFTLALGALGSLLLQKRDL